MPAAVLYTVAGIDIIAAVLVAAIFDRRGVGGRCGERPAEGNGPHRKDGGGKQPQTRGDASGSQ
jgi:hypothetical protein